MIEKDWKVTLEDEARGITMDAGSSAFLDWLCSFSAIGDDGKQYWFGCSPLILKLENIDLFTYEFSAEPGEIVQDPYSVYKVAQFPPVTATHVFKFPGGTHKVRKTDDQVIVDIGCLHVECNKDNSWHYVIDDQERSFKADFIHKPICGGPLWYGREKPSYLTQHSITYGYNWTGQVEGTITHNGKSVHMKGAGIRERYVATDSSSAEIGGWEDWGWFHFDEVFGSMYDMRLGMKDFAINLVEEQIYIPSGSFSIEHHDWAYYPQFGGFIPGKYRIKFETEEGVLDMTAHVATATLWGVTSKVPDNPVATLDWERVEGTFTYKDGRVKKLTNGFGGMSIRQWRQYPSLIPPIKNEHLIEKDRFATL
ncbi:hypothetical protein K7I13_12375 [Brucepastera parasyntrophica]|uniref:hypothetical protein n=1 Tax=Brucepastera parasyntrophica TaxID=2880008 RepID=UPI00210C637C|nr:hypothetical protein [Brucepastera parasyntrophica]ULQ59278.1 hypothetical protein K7I13_12375 [Brucepastera parasyntrophica]